MLHNILSTEIWLMEPIYVSRLLELASSKDILECVKDPEELALIFFDEENEADQKPYKTENGIAVIDIEGTLMKKAKGFFARLFGIRGMEDIGNAFNMALDDEEVKAIFLNIDSPGGTVDGTVALSDIIYAGRGRKPTMAFNNGSMTSGSYWIGSSADSVVMSESTANIGSIGVILIHREVSKAAEEAGVKFTIFSSGDFKKAGNPYEKLEKKERDYLQSRILSFKSLFVEGVVKNRNTPETGFHKDVFQSKIFIGQEGIDVGLADEILSRSQAMEKLRLIIDGKSTINKSKPKGGVSAMDLENRILALEKELTAKTEALATANADLEKATKADHESVIVGLNTKISELETANEGLSKEIDSLKIDVNSKIALAKIGEKAIDNLKDSIKKLSVQVKGDKHNEALLDKQLEAFADDFESLVMMESELKDMRDKLFTKGELNPDDKPEKTQAEIDQEDYELGQNIGKASKSGKVIQLKQS